MISSFVFFCPPDDDAGGGEVVELCPERSRPSSPFNKSAPPSPPPAFAEGAGAGSPPKTPRRSSILLLCAGALVAGDWTRTGVPARPSRPDKPVSGSFCADAGAVPSKSISNRFSTLFWACGGGVEPVTAAAAAAAANGFSFAFWICSLNTSQHIITRGTRRGCTNSIAARWTASAPNLPWPTNCSGGL